MSERRKWFALGWFILFLTAVEATIGIFAVLTHTALGYVAGAIFLAYAAYAASKIVGHMVEEAREHYFDGV